jgi:hypothetical protein
MANEHIRHRLGTAVQFVDIFTSKPVDLPLDVRADTLPIVPGMPGIPWRAARGPNDGTYRFLVNNETVMPIGNIPVTVIAPGKEYVDFEPFAVALPRPFVAHPPTPARSDFLVQHPLWPTRSLGLPAGETAIVAHFISGGVTPIARLKVTIWPDGQAIPPSPYTYSTDDGELVYRLPNLKTVTGGVIAPDASLLIDVKLPPAYISAVAPTQMTTDTGTLLAVPFPIRLGRVTNLTITLP